MHTSSALGLIRTPYFFCIVLEMEKMVKQAATRSHLVNTIVVYILKMSVFLISVRFV